MGFHDPSPPRSHKGRSSNLAVPITDVCMNKLECLKPFETVKFWHSRTRELIANAETYTYPAFREPFRELRRESRRAEFALVVALYQFEEEMGEQATDADNR